MQNALKSNEWWWIWVHKTFKIEIHKGGRNNSDFLENLFPLEIRFPLFNLQTFQDSEKSTPQSCRTHWNLMNDDGFGSIKLSKLKHRRGYQIIKTFCKIGYPQKLARSSLICRIFKTLRKIHLDHAESIEMWWMKMNFDP